MNHIEFYQRIAGKYGTAFLHRRRFPLLVYLSFNRKTGETLFRLPFIIEKNITVLSPVLNRVFHFHRHLHLNVNVVFQKYESYFHSTLPANQVRFFPSFPMVTSHYQRKMYSVANTHSPKVWKEYNFPGAPVFQRFAAGNSTNLNSPSLLPPAGQNPFEKALTEGAVRHLPKLLLMKSFWTSERIVNDSFRTSMTNLTVDNRRSFIFPRSLVFQGSAARMLMKETTHAERVRTYRQTESTGAAFVAPGGGSAHTHIGRALTDKHFTPAPGAATTATAAKAAAAAEAAPSTTATTAAAAYTTPAVLTPLTGRIPLTSLAPLTPLTPLTSRALAHIPTTATAAGSDRSDQSDWSDRSTPSDRFRGKRPETLILEHPRPGPGAGSGVGSRKTAPRSLESLDRYEEAPITATKTGPGKIINETVSTHPGKTQVFSPPEVDLHRLTDQVYRMLEKKIKTERERRGW